MRRFYILLGIIFIVGVYGIIKSNQFSKKNRSILQQQNSVQESTQSQKEANDIKLLGLINKNVALKCTFSAQAMLGTLSGEIFIDGKKIRLNMTAPDNLGNLKTSHTIVKEDASYLWYDGNVTGMKTLITQDEVGAQTTSSEQNIETFIQGIQRLVGTTEELSYNCDQWDADSFEFGIPATVKFINANDLYQNVYERLCQRCDAEPAPADRIFCRQKLKCK